MTAPPPVLTPERIDAMLSIMAEVCLESVVDAGQRQKAAPDFEEFERAGRSLQRACRNLRQAIAMKQRHDREQDRKADDGRRLAEIQRKDAERNRDAAVDHRRARVERHFERVLWDEYDGEDAEERFDDLEARLRDLAEDPDFLDTPLDTLIQGLADSIGLNDPPEPEPEPEPDPEPARVAAVTEAPGVLSALSAQTPALETDAAAEALDPPVELPPRPPDPPPESSIPPWEQLRPGQVMRGGSGW